MTVPPSDTLSGLEPEQRRQAIAELSDVALQGSRDLVLEGLGDENWRVRKEAAVKAAKLAVADRTTQEALVNGICDAQNVGRRNTCLEVFSMLGPEGALIVLERFETLPPASRRFAVEALGLGGSDAAVPVLLRAMESEDENLVLAAMEALSRVGGAVAIDALRASLAKGDLIQQVTALQGLERLAVDLPWSELSASANVPILRRSAISLLGRTDDLQALEPLVEAVVNDSESAAQAAVCALAQFVARHPDWRTGIAQRLRKVETAGLRVTELMQAGPGSVRAASLELLLLARDESCLREFVKVVRAGEVTERAVEEARAWGTAALSPVLALAAQLTDADRAVALEVAGELARSAQEGGSDLPVSDLGALREAMRGAAASGDARLELAAANVALSWAEPVDAQWLFPLANGTSSEVLNAAAEAIEALALGNPETLRGALNDVDVGGGEDGRLLFALTLLEGDAALTRLRSSLASDRPATRKSAVNALGELKGPVAAEYVALALADDDLEVQLEAIRSLGQFQGVGTSVPVDRLTSATRSPNADIRVESARALGCLGDEAGVAALVALAHDSEPAVVLASIRSLRRFTTPDLISVFVDQLHHTDPEVIKECLAGLRTETADAAFEPICKLLAHPSWDVRQLAVAAIASYGDRGRSALTARIEQEQDPLVRKTIDHALDNVLDD